MSATKEVPIDIGLSLHGLTIQVEIPGLARIADALEALVGRVDTLGEAHMAMMDKIFEEARQVNLALDKEVLEIQKVIDLLTAQAVTQEMVDAAAAELRGIRGRVEGLVTPPADPPQA